MKLKLAAILIFALGSIFAAASPAGADDDPMAAFGPLTALSWGDIVPPDALNSFAYSIHRELTGSAAQRVHRDHVSDNLNYPGLVPALSSSNPRLSTDITGLWEKPNRFTETLRYGGTSNALQVWFIGDQGRIRYNDSALYVAADTHEAEAIHWWAYFEGWLEDYGRFLRCGSATRLINDQQAIRCDAPTLSLDSRIALLDRMGIWAVEDTVSLSAFNFELWLTQNDTIPVRLEVSGTGRDAKDNALSGLFQLNLTRINSRDIRVNLPRS